MGLQPWLHDLVSCVAAPVVVLGSPDGQLRPLGASGLLVSDRRLLSTLRFEANGRPLTPIGSSLHGAASARFTSVARGLGDTGADPTVLVVQHRTALSTGFRETLEVDNRSATTVRTVVSLVVGSDFLSVHNMKTGNPHPEVPPTAVHPDGCTWVHDGAQVTITAMPTPDEVAESSPQVHLEWHLELPPGASSVLTVNITCDESPLFSQPTEDPLAADFHVRARDFRLERWVEQGLADLRRLILTDPLDQADCFVAAGSPWFFTLFGRDSLWTARMLLPLGTELAAGTLRTLARRQGRVHDVATGEAPGKIMHELRPGPPAAVDGRSLPSSYYGTIDATPLWVTLLAEAWRWGLETTQVRDLLDPLHAALVWILDSSGLHDGYVRYIDESGRGLANQGWKDSGDSVQHLDGRLAEPPIALCEVQAYSVEALRNGADLLETFVPGSDLGRRCRTAADALQARFRSDFWVERDGFRYPAIALDRDGAKVETATSNLGHLLGTGLLQPDEAAAVARRIAAEDLTAPYGLRTMSADHPRFNPVGYHTGSIWPHDTGIAIVGLSREGHRGLAFRLAQALLAASPAFDYRMPELLHGTDPGEEVAPLPYPASCRPQAWSAAAGIAIATAALDLQVDVPRGRVEIAPIPEFADWWPLTITGLRIAGEPIDINVDVDGHLSVNTALDIVI